MVGMARFERATPASRTQCPTGLGHIPTGRHDIKFNCNCPSLFLHGHNIGRLVTFLQGDNCVIIYDLRCAKGHKFEGWFQDRAAFETQKTQKLISCPICNGSDIEMVPSSVAIMGKDVRSSEGHNPKELSPMKALKAVHDYINKHFEDVGDSFADVALKIHRGDEEGRNIKGTTTEHEEENLREEGVQFIKIPLIKYDG